MSSSLEPHERTYLLEFLGRRFDLTGLKTLAFNLGLDHEAFPQATKEDFCRELILYHERQNNVACLLIEILRHHPDDTIAGMLHKLTSCRPREKMLIIIEENIAVDKAVFIAALSRLLGMMPDEITVLGMASGSTQLLVALPAGAANRLTVPGVLELGDGGYRIAGIVPFNGLDPAKQAEWRERVVRPQPWPGPAGPDQKSQQSSSGTAGALAVVMSVLAIAAIVGLVLWRLVSEPSGPPPPTDAPASLTATAAAGAIVPPASATPSPTNASAASVTPSVTSLATATVVVTPTASATATPCLPLPAFERDVTVPDGTQVQPGTGFTKIWRVRNLGLCAWDASYLVVFIRGDRLSAPAVMPIPPAAPGQAVDLAVPMAAPMAPGHYVDVWQIRSPLGVLLGPELTVDIVVPFPATSTPTRTPTGAASATPSATPQVNVPSSSPPAAPSGLVCHAQQLTPGWFVRLDWSDNSSDESEFHIEYASPQAVTLLWQPLTSVGANQTVYQPQAPGDPTLSYRVRAHRHSDGQYSVYSSVATCLTATPTP